MQQLKEIALHFWSAYGSAITTERVCDPWRLLDTQEIKAHIELSHSTVCACRRLSKSIMADYSQPPYGMPFYIPPQQPQHIAADAPAVHQSAPSDPRQPSLPNNFNFGGGLPGLNMQSYNQNAQQPQLPFWPQPPAADQNTYSPVSFVGQFAPQSGFPIPPPPPPGSAFFAAPPPLPFQTAPLPSPAGPPPVQRFPGAINERVVGVMDSEREDGEVSENDGPSKRLAGHRQSYASPPPSVPQPPPGLEMEGVLRRPSASPRTARK